MGSARRTGTHTRVSRAPESRTETPPLLRWHTPRSAGENPSRYRCPNPATKVRARQSDKKREETSNPRPRNALEPTRRRPMREVPCCQPTYLPTEPRENSGHGIVPSRRKTFTRVSPEGRQESTSFRRPITWGVDTLHISYSSFDPT